MKTILRQYSKPALSILLAVILMTSTLMVGAISSGSAARNEKAADTNIITTDDAVTADANTGIKSSSNKAKKDKSLTGANAKNLTGYTNTVYVRGSWDNWAKPDNSIGHIMTNNTYTCSLQANTDYSFVFLADNGDQFSAKITIASTTNSYNFPKNTNDAITLHTTIAGTYTFTFKNYDGGQTCMTCGIGFPVDNTPTTWTAVGAYGASSSSDAGFFGTAWAPTATANDMTKSGTTWSKTWNNVTLDTSKTVYYKVAKNHKWDTAYPSSSNATQTIPAGTYNITITYNESNNNVNLTYTSVAKSTLTVQSNIANAVVKATYNGTTVGEGESISNVLQGAAISISVTPDSGYQCTAVTGTYNTNSTVSGTGSGNSWSLTMPGANTTVSVTLGTVSMKKIYFNNNYTQYGTVYAYVYDKSGSNHTYEYLGARPGKVMKETDNTEMWYIEVPSDVDYVEFISGDGKTTGELTIPWSTYTYPKYIAPYNYDAPTTANGGTWGNYKWGNKIGDQRDNVYTVSDGTTMNNSNLFTGITASFYDYYVDGEVDGSNGWLQDIGSNEYSGGTNWEWHPYDKLNAALSSYADDTKTRDNANWSNPSQPKYGVSYPLYFGNLNTRDGGAAMTSYVNGLYNWHAGTNNSLALSADDNAAIGLSGKTLGDDNTIHYYKSGATNENGAPMAMFNEDFLSGENSQNKALGTILRTSSFPVRKTVEGATPETKTVYLKNSSGGGFNHTSQVWCHTWKSSNTSETYDTFGYYNGSTQTWSFSGIPSSYDRIQFVKSNSNTNMNYNGGKLNDGVAFNSSHNTYSYNLVTNNIYLNLNGQNWTTASAQIKAHLWNSSGSTDKTLTLSNGKYYCDASGYTNVIFYRKDPNGSTWWNKTADLTVRKGRTFYLSDFNGGGSWDTDSDYYNWSWTGSAVSTTPGTAGHTYYEFDSTNGKDNAYITDVNKTNKTAKINYYTDKKVKSSNNTYGFFPFDYNTYQSHLENTAHDLGFGMKLEIPFTLNENGLNDDGTPQTFDFSGDDDLWVYVDGKLVLDLGGAHARTEGSINFNTKTVTASKTQAIPSGVNRNGSFATGFNTNPNYVHTMTIYYMERGMFESNLKFGFSFHAIPNQFWIDKKIRTKDRANLGHDTINSGFFINNNQTGSDSNMTTYTVGDKTTTMSIFEKSFQNEQFTVTHWYGSSSANTLASGMDYTIDNDSNTHTTGSNGQYPIYHDLGNAFIGQFTTNDKFKLKETISSSNKYVYTPELSVWDQANNDQAITVSGNNTDGYTFDFKPTTNVTGGIENTNIKARFENYMSAHDLVLTKELTNATDTTTSFKFKIQFNFDNTGYVSYPLYCTLDGTRTQLSDTGIISMKAGQTLTIDKIPDKANIKIVEILPKTVTAYRYNSMTVKNGTSALSTSAVSSVGTETITKGAAFTTSNNTTYVTFSNKKPDNRYTIKYIYPSYDNLYGNQSYTVSGVFTESELDTYMQLDGSGGIQFKTSDLKTNFISIKSPYENNFQQTVSFADPTIVDTGTGKGWVDGNYIADATAKTITDDQISVYFNLPYAVDDDSTLVPEESGSSGRVAKIANQAVGSKKISCFDWYVTGGKKNANDTSTGVSAVYVKAPLMLYTDVADTSTIQYFQYWSVKKQSGYGMKAAEYTRCYDYEFNLSLFMDCVIEPVYASTWAQTDGNPNPPRTYNQYDRFDPEVQITGDSTKGISIAFLENSRNQYNNDGKGGKTNGAVAADTIFSDFLLSFNKVGGLTQLNQLPANTKKAGIVIEAVGDLSGNNTVGYDTSIEYSKDSNYTGNESTSRTNIINWLQGSSTKPSGVNKSEFDVRGNLDNKNCIQYYTSIKNRNVDDSSGNLLNTNNNRYKVFRAYAYIGDVNGSSLKNVTLSDPIYFTIYDIGKLYDLADNKS